MKKICALRVSRRAQSWEKACTVHVQAVVRPRGSGPEERELVDRAGHRSAQRRDGRPGTQHLT